MLLSELYSEGIFFHLSVGMKNNLHKLADKGKQIIFNDYLSWKNRCFKLKKVQAYRNKLIFTGQTTEP